MLFNSYAFLFVFLPLTLACFHVLRARGLWRSAILALTCASLAFYGWWSLRGLGLLVILMSVNFVAVKSIIYAGARTRTATLVCGVTIAFNLAVLGYFKYANFLLDNWHALTGSTGEALHIILPLGLSFFTFQKIALLVDAAAGRVERLSLLDYLLFVTFFPQLIAGPIVHHAELLPQFAKPAPVEQDDLARGFSLFVIGLSKKVLLADNLAPWVAPIFDDVAQRGPVGFLDSWTAAIAYSLQLYFDFSGYCDMAIGLALLFGVRLPANFNSPYKSADIIDFWRRWHMTLSRFLRDYLYIPLGGNRHGRLRQSLALVTTMGLGGLWHGASWNFVIWGLLHAGYLSLNHLWRRLVPVSSGTGPRPAVRRVLAQGLTLVAVVAAWVIFRAVDMATAGHVLAGMAGLGGFAGTSTPMHLAILFLLLAAVLTLPNSAELTAMAKGASARWRGFAPSRTNAVFTGVLLALCLMSLTRVSEFLYFQF